MKPIYKASNLTEAHMILNLLEQHGLSAHLDGDHPKKIKGSIGILIEESDYKEGKRILNDFDKNQPKGPLNESPKESKKISFSLFSCFIGFCLGLFAIAIYYNSPLNRDGVDYNGDGLLDEKWFYINDVILKTELDRNFDGKADLIYKYDRKGIVKSSKSDENFDGVYETKSKYINGNAIWSKSDTNGDGIYDCHIFFENGVFKKIEFIDPSSLKPLKVQYYDGFKLIKAEFDSNRDGILDTIYKYDELEEILEKSDK